MLTQLTIQTARLVVGAMKVILDSEWLTSPMTYKVFGISGSAIDGEDFATIVNDPREGTLGIDVAVGPRALDIVTLGVMSQLGIVPVDESYMEGMRAASQMTAVWTPLREVPPHLRQLPTALGYSERRETVIPELVVWPTVGDDDSQAAIDGRARVDRDHRQPRFARHPGERRHGSLRTR